MYNMLISWSFVLCTIATLSFIAVPEVNCFTFLPLTSITSATRSHRGRYSRRPYHLASTHTCNDKDNTMLHTLEPGTLACLCDITKQACFAVTPMIRAFYSSLSRSSTSIKADSSVFTIADGTLQHLFTNYLFSRSDKFKAVVGEEECQVNVEHLPYTVNDMVIPPEFTELVDEAKRVLLSLSQEIASCDLYKSLTIFIDPIDGTKEFTIGMGEQCTICIGFANAVGHPVAGVVYRPINLPSAPHLGPTWAAGAKPEEYLDCHLDVSPSSSTRVGLLTSNGGISQFVVELMHRLGYERIKSGGAGNKMLLLLEGKGSAYIQDRGVSRWDTCAAQACIEAHGGIVCKLTSFLCSEGKEEGYTYLKSDKNLDFSRGMANLTIYNARSADEVRKNQPTCQAIDVMEVKAYSNLCGLLAIPRELNTVESKKRLLEAVKAASEISLPAYD